MKLLTIFLLMSSFANAADVIDGRVEIPAKPENGMQIILPETTVPMHAQKMYCWYTTLTNQTELQVTLLKAYQGPGGHHIVGQLVRDDAQGKPDNTLTDCTTSVETMDSLPVLIAGYPAPEGLTYILPPKARMMFQFHYHNHEAKPILVRDVVNIYFADPNKNLTPTSPWGTATINFVIPPNQDVTKTYECPVENDIKVYFASGHMHEYGTSFKAEIVDGEKVREAVNIPDWQPEYKNGAPFKAWPIQAPLQVKAGSKLRVTCSWRTKLDKWIYFPDEMCSSIFFYFPGKKTLVCLGS